MNKHFYYVVVAKVNDDGSTTFELDPYTEDARFQDGSVWNDDTEEWEEYNSPENGKVSEELTDALLHSLGRG
jgi:hypothetical protein